MSVKLVKVWLATANRHTPVKWHFVLKTRSVSNVAHYNIRHNHQPSNTTLSPSQHDDPSISIMPIFTMNPAKTGHKLKIYFCRLNFVWWEAYKKTLLRFISYTR